MDQQQTFHNARRYVEALKLFNYHALIFAGVMILLLIINVMVSKTWWVQWPFIGWGIALIGHAIAVFRPISIMGPEWEKRKMREYIEREREKQPPTA